MHKKTAIEYAVKIMNIVQKDPQEEIEILLNHLSDLHPVQSKKMHSVIA